ncbi:MAG TPA: COX15/CtaA family protein [Nitrososphaeraceae archaeon]
MSNAYAIMPRLIITSLKSSYVAQQRIITNKMLWFSFASLVLLYGVMLIGIYITASHQGLSCPDWPLCPNGFNFPPPKYFFEHVHRVLAVITAGVIFTSAFYSAKKAKNVRTTAVAAGIIISVQIFLGVLVINKRLEALLVATHLSTGVLLFAMTLMTFLLSYRLANGNSKI